MEKNIISYFIWLVVVMLVTVFLFWFFGLQAVSPEAQSVQSQLPYGASSSAVSSSQRMVLNSAGHYRVAVPVGWYVEKNSTTGVALYPDYDPQAGAQPGCKIEISVLPNKENLMLGDWLTAYLRQDPTADVAATSQAASRVSGRDAIIWTGALNGVPAMLAYVVGDGVVYEIAPSVVAAGGQCQASFDVVLKNFTITTP